MIKIHGGTRSEQKRLCDSCSRGFVMRGGADSQEYIHCNTLDGKVPFRVVECTNYYDKSQPAISDLYETAWILETSKNKRALGFTPWKDYKEKHPNAENEKYNH